MFVLDNIVKVRLKLLKKCDLILDDWIVLVVSEVFPFLLCVDEGRFIGSPYPVAGGPSMEDDPMCYLSGLLASLLPLFLDSHFATLATARQPSKILHITLSLIQYLLIELY